MTLTIELSDPLAQQIKQSGLSQQQLRLLVSRFMENYLEQHHHNDEPVSPSPLPSVINEEDSLSPDTAAELSQLDYLTDDDLWQAAQTQLTPEEIELMQTLSTQQQIAELTIEEKETATRLSERYQWTMLVRAKAAALLKQRGYDISALRQRQAIA